MNRLSGENSCPICSQLEGDSLRIRFFVTWISSEWSSIMHEILEQAVKCGHLVDLVDVTKFVYPRVSIEPKDFLDTIQLAESVRTICWRPSRRKKSPLSQPSERPQWLVESIGSELRTKYRGNLTEKLNWIERLEGNSIAHLSLELYQQCLTQKVSEGEVWVYPNGRYAVQRSILEAANEGGLPSLCYERSRFPGRAYIRPYRVHDRVDSQKDFRASRASIPAESRGLVREWITARANPDSGVNPFAKRFSASQKIQETRKENSVVFFSSSRDELEGLGSHWTNFGWDDQYHAFSEIGQRLRERGYETTIRLHPNLANKSLEDIRQEFENVKRLRNEGFNVIGPNDSINSYELVTSARAIVVSRSTIGIESLALGLPVFVTSNSFYDQLSSVCVLDRLDAIGNFEEYIENFNQHEAMNEALDWLAFNWERDFPIQNSFTIRPRLIQSLKNIFHMDVLLYYLSAQLSVRTAQYSKKRALEKFTRL
jgi:hypothetical protein